MSPVSSRSRRTSRFVALAAGAILGIIVPLGTIEFMLSAHSTDASVSSGPPAAQTTVAAPVGP